MCQATSASRKAGSVSKKKSQFVDTNKAYLMKLGVKVSHPYCDGY